MLAEQKNKSLRTKYESGNLSADDFLSKLFDSREGDRKRRKIEQKYKKITNSFRKE